MAPAKSQKTGSIYSSDFRPESRRIVEKPKADPFVNYCKVAYKYVGSYARGYKLPLETKEVFDFLNYEVKAEEFRAAQLLPVFVGAAIGFVFILLGFLLAIGFDPSNISIDVLLSPVLIGAVIFAFIIPVMGYFVVSSYPAGQAKKEQTMALGYLTEVINYMISSMRLVPNMEKAIEFTATHGRGKIADDMKKLVWDVQIGKYNSIEEGLDELAYKWGKYNDDFKQALMIIRSSGLESDDAKRNALLEKAAADVVEGSKEKMDVFARALAQPTVYLYYFGVLLPLMLAIVLPIGATMVKGFIFARPEILALIYIVGLPIGLYALGTMILGSRPPTYVAPDIPEDFPGLPPKGTFKLGGVTLPLVPTAICVFLGIIALGFFADQIMFVFPIPSFENKTEILAKTLHVITPLGDVDAFFVGPFSLLSIICGIAISISVYLFGKYSERKKIQDDIRYMEREFKDAIYVLASRLGENRPMEEALRHAVAFLPNSKIGKRVFQKILDNVTTLGMTLDEAVFNTTFGALRDLPSNTIESGMRITIDSVRLGVNVAAKSLIGLALQLRNAEKIDNNLKELLSGVTQMLKTMGTFIAPIVLGVVTSLQGVITNSVAGNCASTAAEEATPAASSGFGGGGMANAFCSGDASSKVEPSVFMMIMGFYVIEVVILLTYFNSQVEDSNNRLHTYIEISKALPIAAVIFCAVAYVAGGAIGAG